MGKPFGIHVTGPLEPFVTGFLAELARQGFTPWSATSYLGVMRHLSGWLDERGMAVAALTPQQVQEFVAERRARGYAKGRSTGGMVGTLIIYLREVGAILEATRSTPRTYLDAVLHDFTRYELDERGVTQETLGWYRYVALKFLSRCDIDQATSLEGLRADQVIAFMLAESRHRGAGSQYNLAVALRSLLRFLFLQGHLSRSLAAAVLPGPSWHDHQPPRTWSEPQVAQLLAGCDRHTRTGCRDFAIMTLLARLGLRAKEVVALTLDDVDWRRGEILVTGKNNRSDRFPLPVDVGEALAEYCCRARPTYSCRAVFLKVRAPYTALSSTVVSQVVHQASIRAGLPPAGAHQLRRSAATAMRRCGTPLREIGQVLRHSRARTTAQYTREDPAALAGIARPWPGGGNR